MSIGGLSAPRLRQLHEVMARYVEAGVTPGLVTLVSRRGETHVDMVGTMALGGTEPMRRETIFRVSSMTKPVVAVATMVLVETCRIRLDDPVDDLLPELAGLPVLRSLDAAVDDTVPLVRPIAVRDLLTFTLGSGMLMGSPQDYPIVAALLERGLAPGPPSPATTPPPDEWLARMASLPLMHQPGERWMYNTGSELLGILIERASGQSLETYVREQVFGPLGMKDSGFWVPASSIDRLATSYWTSWQTGSIEVYDESADGQWSRPPVFPSGGGGLVSTVDDYLAFGEMLLGLGRRGSERVLSRPTVETMTTDQLTAAQKAATGSGQFDTHGWGFGMSVVTRRTEPAASVGTFGWDGGMGTTWFCDPREDMVMILMTQSAWTSPDPPPIRRDFLTGVYAAIDD